MDLALESKASQRRQSKAAVLPLRRAACEVELEACQQRLQCSEADLKVHCQASRGRPHTSGTVAFSASWHAASSGSTHRPWRAATGSMATNTKIMVCSAEGAHARLTCERDHTTEAPLPA